MHCTWYEFTIDDSFMEKVKAVWDKSRLHSSSYYWTLRTICRRHVLSYIWGPWFYNVLWWFFIGINSSYNELHFLIIGSILWGLRSCNQAFMGKEQYRGRTTFLQVKMFTLSYQELSNASSRLTHSQGAHPTPMQASILCWAYYKQLKRSQAQQSSCSKIAYLMWLQAFSSKNFHCVWSLWFGTQESYTSHQTVPIPIYIQGLRQWSRPYIHCTLAMFTTLVNFEIILESLLKRPWAGSFEVLPPFP